MAAASRIVVLESRHHQQVFSLLLHWQPLLLMLQCLVVREPPVVVECRNPLTVWCLHALLVGDLECLLVDQEWLMLAVPLVQCLEEAQKLVEILGYLLGAVLPVLGEEESSTPTPLAAVWKAVTALIRFPILPPLTEPPRPHDLLVRHCCWAKL